MAEPGPAHPTRRALLILVAASAVSSTIFRSVRAASAALRTVLTEAEPAALAVAYIADATKVDRRLFPAYRRGQSCATCQFIDFGTARQRGCSVIPGRLVLAGAWCKLWKLRGSK